MQFVDTHCHLDFDSFDADRAAVVARAQAAGVTRIIIPAIDLGNCATVIALCEQFAGVTCAVGIHPNSSADWQPGDIALLRDYAQHPKVVAIGEIGLDYYWDKAPKATQQAAFVAQMALAAELDLPVIIHNRDAAEDTISLMWASPLVDRPNAGVMHSFSAAATVARKAINLGFYIGFTGPLTFKNADALRTIAAELPLDRLLLETDAPFLTPEPQRGKRNEPAYIPLIADRLAALRQRPLAEVAAQTTANAERLFGLEPA